MVPVLRSRRGHDVDGDYRAPAVQDVGGTEGVVERDSIDVSLPMVHSGLPASPLSALPEEEISEAHDSRRATRSETSPRRALRSESPSRRALRSDSHRRATRSEADVSDIGSAAGVEHRSGVADSDDSSSSYGSVEGDERDDAVSDGFVSAKNTFHAEPGSVRQHSFNDVSTELVSPFNAYLGLDSGKLPNESTPIFLATKNLSRSQLNLIRRREQAMAEQVASDSERSTDSPGKSKAERKVERKAKRAASRERSQSVQSGDGYETATTHGTGPSRIPVSAKGKVPDLRNFGAVRMSSASLSPSTHCRRPCSLVSSQLMSIKRLTPKLVSESMTSLSRSIVQNSFGLTVGIVLPDRVLVPCPIRLMMVSPLQARYLTQILTRHLRVPRRPSDIAVLLESGRLSSERSALALRRPSG